MISCCLLLLHVGSMQAQEFNPTNPAEPQTPVFYYPLTVACEPSGAAYVSGKGNYAPGSTASISTSPKSGYYFNHWELNGIPYEAGTSFSYTTIAGQMDFVAVYDFIPDNPSEPVMDVRSRLYLSSEPEGVCTFNRTSGDWAEAGKSVDVNVVGIDPQYEFTGWYLGEVKLSDEQSFDYLKGYHDEELVAHFNLLPFNPSNPSDPDNDEGGDIFVKYKFTYLVDGEEYKSFEYPYGLTITPIDEPTKEGYTFSGWSEIPATMPAKDVTVEGTFSINSYKLTYLVDGEEYQSSTLKYGDGITPIDEPTKEGYTFSGWGEIPETMPAKDVTVEGTFSINSYKLTYLVDGEEYQSTIVKYGDAITPIDEPTQEGYTFSGWSDIPETMPAKDVTIEGTFSINSYKLTYLVDGEEYQSTIVKYGDAIIPIGEPKKEGYTFSGWSEIPETMPAKDVTVEGSFSINSYKLTYLVDGEEYQSSTLKYGDGITPIDKPTKEGYTFSGWSEIPATMPAKDVTIEGTFSINSYKLTYMVDGEEYQSTAIKYGDAITPIDEPTKEGHTFSGWSEIPETMPAKDVTVEGTFSINSYKLTYLVDGEEYKTTEVEYGSPITPEQEPMMEGFIFSGWSEIPETMPAKDVIVEGTFTPDTTGLDGIAADAEDGKAYFNMNGQSIPTLQKGMNIVKKANGQTVKVFVR